MAAVLVAAGCVGNIGDGDHSAAGDVDGPGPDGTGVDCSARQSSPMPLRRLTRSQYDNAIRDLLEIGADTVSLDSLDEKVGPFDANYKVPVSQVGVDAFAALAESISDEVDLGQLLSCSPTEADDGNQQACAQDFIAGFGRRAYRRSLTADEQARYLAVFQEVVAIDSFQSAMRTVLMAFLQSPHLLYHMEIGQGAAEADGLVALPAPELASRLSFFLWNSIPDDALLDAAEAGELGEPEALRGQVERMLQDDKARRTISAFTLQWLKLDALASLEKAPTEAVPELSEEMKNAMRDEVVAFADHVIRDDDSRFETLMTAPYTMFDPVLADLYGVEGGGQAGEPVDLDPAQRAGVLTLTAWLATQAHTAQSSPVLRGVAVRENILCQPLAPPPANVNNTPPEIKPGLTTRERFAAHTANEECAACHTLIDGIGFGFEAYDAFGAFRTIDNGLPVDDSGEVVNLDGQDVPFHGAVELAQLVAQSKAGRDCIQQQWTRFALARPSTKEDVCAFDAVSEKFAASDWSLRELLTEIVLSDPFRFRPGAQP